jgi:hypothetical protein
MGVDMSKLLAFQVAKPAPGPSDVPQPHGYDAALQALVWQGDETAGMASAVCTRTQAGYGSCSDGGTACRLGSPQCVDPWLAMCYVCDY